MQTIIKSAVKSGAVPKFNFSNQVSLKTLQQIKNSIPLLESKGLEISNGFYQKEIFPKDISFFSKDPSTQGRQGKTLADFLVSLAKRAENLESMNTHFERISSKHAGFGIQPEHYPIFTGGIIASLKANGAKPEQVAAWTELLEIVAKSLINQEAKKYQKNTNQVGGWNGTRAFNIKEKNELGNGVTSYYLYPADGKEIANFEGGQYVTVKANLPKYGEQFRHVTLSNTPNKHPYYRLTACKDTDIGAYLGGKKEGESVELLQPRGRFTLQGHFNDVVLIGSGNANLQLIQIANSAQTRNIYYIQIVNNANKDALKFFFDKYQALNKNWKTIQVNTDAGESLCYETVANFAPTKNADYYFVANNPAEAHQVNDVLTTVGIDKNHKYYEFEGPYEFLN